MEWVLEWHLRCTLSTDTIMALHQPARHTCNHTRHLHTRNLLTMPHRPRTTSHRSIHERGPCPGNHHAVGPHRSILPPTHPWTLGRIRHGLMKIHPRTTIPREMLSVTVLPQDNRNRMKTTIGCHRQELSPSPGHRSTRRSDQSGQTYRGRCIPLRVLSHLNVSHPGA